MGKRILVRNVRKTECGVSRDIIHGAYAGLLGDPTRRLTGKVIGARHIQQYLRETMYTEVPIDKVQEAMREYRKVQGAKVWLAR